jgi:uncharacterized protein
MNKVIDSFKTSGVKENETGTSSFDISPDYNSNYSQSYTGDIGRIVGFKVSNPIQIESTNLKKVSKWVDVAVAAGANTINNIDFNLSDRKLEEIKSNLMRQAIEDAK